MVVVRGTTMVVITIEVKLGITVGTIAPSIGAFSSRLMALVPGITIEVKSRGFVATTWRFMVVIIIVVIVAPSIVGVAHIERVVWVATA